MKTLLSRCLILVYPLLCAACAHSGRVTESTRPPDAISAPLHAPRSATDRSSASAAASNSPLPSKTIPHANADTMSGVTAGSQDTMAKSYTRDNISELLVYALSLVGVKYQFGGNSAETGFDCSGFVRHVFTQLGMRVLPRRAEEMSRVGERVEKDELAPGDLVFYNTLKRPYSHVGIYLGEGRFVHSPSAGRSVEIVNMADNYWLRRYNGARRVSM
jgi:cell wall-associated NlpC family hydrolase